MKTAKDYIDFLVQRGYSSAGNQFICGYLEYTDLEKKVQKFIDSLQPGDIIYWKDLDVIELAWFEVKFLEVFDIERRELRIQEIHSFKQSVKLISAYDYLSGSLLTKEEYDN